MQYLRQSTAGQSVLIGVFVDSTDGVTAETGLTIANTDIRLSANGGNMFAKTSGGGTHDEAGWYTITLDATDTATVGRLQLSVAVTGALPVFAEYQVLEEVVYDALFAASATGALPATLVQGGINTTSGTLTTLDALDTAQDTQHGTTQSSVSSVGTLVTTVDTVVDGIATQIGTAGNGLSAVPWNAAWDAEVQSEVEDGLAAYDPPTKAELDTAESNIRGADSDTIKTLSDQIDGLSTAAAPQLLQNTTIATLASQTSFTLTAGSADNSAYDGAIIVVTDQSTSTQKAVGSISSYVGSTKTVTLSADPAIFTMAVGDTVDILAAIGSAPTAAAIRAEIDSNSTQLAAIVADTNEMQTDWANGGRLDLILDARASQASVDTAQGALDNLSTDDVLQAITNLNDLDAAGIRTAVGLASANLDTQLTTIDGIVDAILVDTGSTLQNLITDLPADILTNLFVDASWTALTDDVTAILVDTGTTLPTTLSSISSAVSVVDGNVDTLITQLTTDVAEPGVPGATATVPEMIATMYGATRNKITVTSSSKAFFNDAGTQVWSKALSDDGTTYTEAEGA